MLLDVERGVELYQRAYEQGVNYFDGRYGDSSLKIRPIIKQDRGHFVVGTKTAETTAEGALHRIDEDLKELDTDYLDVFYLRSYYHDVLEKHLAPGGSMEGVLKARKQGKVHFIGLSGHGDLSVLAKGIETGQVDVVIFPLNIVRREALQQLIPVAQEHDVGLVVMKPVSVGMIPARLALPWLANQPIHTMAPGMSSLEHLEMDVAALERDRMALSPEEEAEVEHYRQELDRETCRICDRICKAACDEGLMIPPLIHHDVFYNQYRSLGLEGFLNHPHAPWVKRAAESHFARRLAMLQSCTRCGKCEEVCPHDLPIMDMFEVMLEDHLPLIEALKKRDWAAKYKDAKSPYLQISRATGGAK